MYSKVIQLYVYMYLFFFKFFSHLGCCIILSRVPCALDSRSLLVLLSCLTRPGPDVGFIIIRLIIFILQTK